MDPARLKAIPGLTVRLGEPLSAHTRFGVGGPADILAEASSEEAFMAAATMAREAGAPLEVVGAGTNLVVADQGFRGVVLRFAASAIVVQGRRVTAQAGAELQSLVDASIAHSLAGIHAMTRIPGLVGAAVYGNAGAYGQSMHEWAREVRFFDGRGIRAFDGAACEFRYRESVFKRHKNWTVLSATLELPPGDGARLAAEAEAIRAIRDEKYPPAMKCAGSVFKNLLYADLPESARAQTPPSKIRDGKVPSAHFLEQVGAKGMRAGGIVSADYHANLIYNEGGGTAAEICAMVDELKARVRARFHFELEEEVQYIGFAGARRSF